MCMQPVLRDIASSSLTLVVTYSTGSQASSAAVGGARSHGSLRTLFGMVVAPGRARALLVGKGSRCSSALVRSLGRYTTAGQAHCIEGPNVGAREAHTVWAFCHDFYEHLPRAVLFVQDDPNVHAINRDLFRSGGWLAALEESFARRAARAHHHTHGGGGGRKPLLTHRWSATSAAPTRGPTTAATTAVAGTGIGIGTGAWMPTPCACSATREKFDEGSYGGYRPIHWWLRTFLSPYTNGSAPLPREICWPTAAQFALPRSAIRGRSRAFVALNLALTEVPAPLKVRVAPREGEREELHKRRAKWANFGPAVVDLGAAPLRGKGYADVRPVINGMDFAQLYERTWFQAFDPALKEAQPAHLACFEPSAIRLSPMRCARDACPYRPPGARMSAGGCAATDALGLTTPPTDWAFGPPQGVGGASSKGTPQGVGGASSKGTLRALLRRGATSGGGGAAHSAAVRGAQERRCLAAGCLVGVERGGGAWSQESPH
jgi:hypothetical protein